MRRYDKALKAFAERTEKEINGSIEALVVYGSVARGEATRESDVDIMVMLNRPSSEMKEKVRRIRDDVVFEYGQAITLDFETYSSLRKMAENDDMFASNVLEEGKALWDRKGRFGKLQAIAVRVYQP